jgi:hypothetical protein
MWTLPLALCMQALTRLPRSINKVNRQQQPHDHRRVHCGIAHFTAASADAS